MMREGIPEDVTAQLPDALRRFLQFEQHNLWKPERFRNPEGDIEWDGRYLPERSATFRLPCFRVQRKSLYIYGEEERSRIWSGVASGGDPSDWFLMPIHPGEVQRNTKFLLQVGAQDASEHGVHLWATPTSSTRTVLTWPDGRPQDVFFAKLSLHSQLLGDRRLTRRKVALSVGLSRFVEECKGDLPSGIRYFPEPLGLTPRRMEESGALFRSIPDEVRRGTVVLAPLFALIGGSAGHPPLLFEMMERQGTSALVVLEGVLLEKFAKLWVDLVFDLGVILEAHGQDLMLALSHECNPLGDFYYRDFEGLVVDWALRRARRLRELSLPHSSDWFLTYETWGYPLYQMISRKLMNSLFDYIHLVLVEVESAVREWQAEGLIRGEKLGDGVLTALFSRYLRKAIHDKFGIREAGEYNVMQPNLTRFVKFLMQVRRDVMRDAAGRC